jgi:hypothetical protein
MMQLKVSYQSSPSPLPMTPKISWQLTSPLTLTLTLVL